MKWKLEVESKHLQSFDLFSIILVVLFLLGIIMQNGLAFIAGALLLVHVVLHKVFEKKIADKVAIKNERRTVRLFPNEEIVWEMEMENKSYFPIVNGELKFNLGHNVQVGDLKEQKKNYWQGIEVPFSLNARRKRVAKLPITAVERGTARFSQLAYKFPHLFSFQEMNMLYQVPYQTEFIVYPELKTVTGLEVVFHQFPGEARMQFSPYEDIQSRIGTRDYEAGDSFQRINWKASVRSQNLQTNVYEKVADRSFVFIVNLKKEQRAGESDRTEDLLSYTAYLTKYATEQDTPYEILLNVRQPSGKTFLQLPEGNDNRHLAKSLEFLARIPRQPISSPFEVLLYQTAKTLQQRKTIIVIGEVDDASAVQITQLQQRGHTVFQLKELDGAAYITPMAIGKTA